MDTGMADQLREGRVIAMEQRATRAVEQTSITDSVMVQDLQEGARVRLRGGGSAEVTANPRDGQWIFVRYLEWPQDPSKVGSEDLAFCTDVVEVL